MWISLLAAALGAELPPEWEACRDGEGDACVQAAEQARDPRHVAALLHHGCLAGSLAACTTADRRLRGAERPPEVRERACALGAADLCDALRDGLTWPWGRDQAARLCEIGHAPACDEQAFFELHLAPVAVLDASPKGRLVPVSGGRLLEIEPGVARLRSGDLAVLAEAVPGPANVSPPNEIDRLRIESVVREGEGLRVLLSRGYGKEARWWWWTLEEDGGSAIEPLRDGLAGCSHPPAPPGGFLLGDASCRELAWYGPDGQPTGARATLSFERRADVTSDGERFWALGERRIVALHTGAEAEMDARRLHGPVADTLLVTLRGGPVLGLDPNTLAEKWRLEGPWHEVLPSPDGETVALRGERPALLDPGTGRMTPLPRVRCDDLAWGPDALLCVTPLGSIRLALEREPVEALDDVPAGWLALPAGWQDLAAGARLSGRVQDPSGRPIAGARVFTRGRTPLFTDADGRFEVLGPEGHLQLHVGAEGMTDETLRPGEDTRIEVQLAPLTEVELHLVGAPDGLEVEGGLVVRDERIRRTALVPGRRYGLHVRHEDRQWRAWFVAGEGERVVVEPEVKPPPPPGVPVRVLDAAGRPAPGLRRGRGETDADGFIEVPSVEDVRRADWARDAVEVTRGGKHTIHLPTLPVVVRPYADQASQVRAVLVREGSELALAVTPGEATTAWLEPGHWTLATVAPEGVAARAIDVTPEIEPITLPTPEEPPVIVVDVFDRRGLPAYGARVTVDYGRGTFDAALIRTDAWGRARAPVPPVGRFAIQADGQAHQRGRAGDHLVFSRDEPPDLGFLASPTHYGLVVDRIPRARQEEPGWLAFGDTIVEACGASVEELDWDDLRDRIVAAGGCTVRVLAPDGSSREVAVPGPE